MTQLQHKHHICRDIPSAWFELLDSILSHGRVWTVEHGSYEGQQRLEFDCTTVHVTHPGSRPLIPDIPMHLRESVPAPCTQEYLEDYLPYLMTNQPLKPNEVYTYGERIEAQMEAIIHRFKTFGYGSNQECIAVAKPEDLILDDPPCLRSIDCRIIPKNALYAHETSELHFFVYFRSWDLFNGFPANLAAIRLMQEYMADCIGVEAGEIIAMSKGLHIYDHVWDHARMLVGTNTDLSTTGLIDKYEKEFISKPVKFPGEEQLVKFRDKEPIISMNRSFEFITMKIEHVDDDKETP